MDPDPTLQSPPFVFSDPAGKRWPRLRLFLLIAGIAVFLGTVWFVETLFVAPQLNLPFSLRQLKGQLKALQTVNPAGQGAGADIAPWGKNAPTPPAGEKTKTPGAPHPPPPPPEKHPADARRAALFTHTRTPNVT